MQKLLVYLPVLYLTVQFAMLGTSCKHEPLLGDDDISPVDTTPVDTTPVDTTDPTGGTPCDPNVVYFNLQILPILQSNCAMSGCHDAASQEDGVILTSYEKVMQTAGVQPFNLDESDLYDVLVEDDLEKRMPLDRPPLSPAQIQIIGNWIAQGAKNLDCDANAGGCDSDNVSYASFIKPLIANSCEGCHGGNSPSGGVNLTTHAGVKAVADNGKLYGVVAWLPGYSKMPQGGNQLPDCSVEKVKSWIDAGAPNN